MPSSLDGTGRGSTATGAFSLALTVAAFGAGMVGIVESGIGGLPTSLMVILLLLTVGSGLLFGWRLYLVSKAMAFESEPLANEECPPIHVIIPVFNEGRTLCDAVQSVLACDYPRNRMRITIVDDGSCDDTWYWIRLVVKSDGIPVEVCHLRNNRGKCRALAHVFKHSPEPFWVTVDSDTRLAPDALRHLLAPLVHEKVVAGVAGHIGVLGCGENLWRTMIDASFVLSFDCVRGAQDVMGSVLCLPGATTALSLIHI